MLTLAVLTTMFLLNGGFNLNGIVPDEIEIFIRVVVFICSFAGDVFLYLILTNCFSHVRRAILKRNTGVVTPATVPKPPKAPKVRVTPPSLSEGSPKQSNATPEASPDHLSV